MNSTASASFDKYEPCITDISAADFVLGDSFCRVDCMVSTAGALIGEINSDFSAEMRCYSALQLLAATVCDQIAASERDGLDTRRLAVAGDSLAGLISLIEAREEDDVHLVYAALILLRLASAQIEALLVRGVMPGTAPRPATDFAAAMAASREISARATRTGTAATGQPSAGVLSPQAIADIDAHIASIQAIIDLLLGGAGDEDAALVNVLDFALQGYCKAKEVEDFDDAWSRLIESSSVLRAARALADAGNGTAPGTLALLRSLGEAAEMLQDKFDGGVHAVEHDNATSQPASIVRAEQAVAA